MSHPEKPRRSGDVAIPQIKLDQFLKLKGIADTGGQAKVLIQSGSIQVNGVVETRRGRKLRSGDQVSLGNQHLQVVLEEGFLEL
jgi:ribosome-associated protein